MVHVSSEIAEVIFIQISYIYIPILLCPNGKSVNGLTRIPMYGTLPKTEWPLSTFPVGGNRSALRKLSSER